MKLKFNNNGISCENTCTICNGNTYGIHKRESNIEKRSSWENESTMKLLGLTSTISQVRFCPNCFHFFRHPLFDEKLIYGNKGFECRKAIYEEYFPETKYGGGKQTYHKSWYLKNKEIFSYIHHIFNHVIKGNHKINSKQNLKILDWGSGDGYLVETISLVSNKVLQLPCEAYCFDYHEWAKDSNSSYFDYLDFESLIEKSPYDIIILSHVLEHVASPIELLMTCKKYLTDGGIIIIALPFEQYSIISSKSSLMNYHQHLFSNISLNKALRKCDFRNINTKVYDLSYRGDKMWNILASASVEGSQQKNSSIDYLIYFYHFFNVLFKVGLTKVNAIMKKSNL